MPNRTLQHKILGAVEIAEGEIARENFDVLVRHMTAEAESDLEVTMATMTADPYWVDYGSGVQLQGQAPIRERYAQRFAQRPGLTVKVKRTVVTESMAILQVLWNGEGGRTLPMLVWMDFQNGKIQGEAAYSNPAFTAQ